LGRAGAGGSLAFVGSTSGTITVQPQATAGTATFTLPNTSGTPAISFPSNFSLSTTTGAVSWTGLTPNGLLYASSGTSVASDRCSPDSTNSLICASPTAFPPQPAAINTTNDANAAYYVTKKSRGGGNTLSGDTLGNMMFMGFANGSNQNTSWITAVQN